MKRVVYDTMLFFQVAAQEPPRLHGTFQAIDARKVQLCLSPESMDEITDVLTRPEFLEKAPHFTSERAAQFFAKIKAVCSGSTISRTSSRCRSIRKMIMCSILPSPLMPITWSRGRRYF